MLESTQHAHNSFVTLTYSDETVPRSGNVDPSELSGFIKRLRKAAGYKIRFYGCGEYGSRTRRPHYHAAIFGYPSCERGRTDQMHDGKCCDNCNTVLDAWKKGRIDVAPLEQGTASYVAGYVTKKYGGENTPEGKTRPFSRMSNRPGIGLDAMHELASSLLKHDLEKELIDVPITLRHGKHEWPLGPYLRRNLRTFIGREKNAPPEILALQAAELHDLRQAAWDTATPVAQKVLEESLGRRIQIESRHRRTRREKV